MSAHLVAKRKSNHAIFPGLKIFPLFDVFSKFGQFLKFCHFKASETIWCPEVKSKGGASRPPSFHLDVPDICTCLSSERFYELLRTLGGVTPGRKIPLCAHHAPEGGSTAWLPPWWEDGHLEGKTMKQPSRWCMFFLNNRWSTVIIYENYPVQSWKVHHPILWTVILCHQNTSVSLLGEI